MLNLSEYEIWYLHKYKNKLEFQESDVSHGKTEVKQGKFVEFKSPRLVGVILEKRINHKTKLPFL